MSRSSERTMPIAIRITRTALRRLAVALLIGTAACSAKVGETSGDDTGATTGGGATAGVGGASVVGARGGTPVGGAGSRGTMPGGGTEVTVKTTLPALPKMSRVAATAVDDNVNISF